jgi:hypothetical protein
MQPATANERLPVRARTQTGEWTQITGETKIPGEPGSDQQKVAMRRMPQR